MRNILIYATAFMFGLSGINASYLERYGVERHGFSVENSYSSPTVVTTSAKVTRRIDRFELVARSYHVTIDQRKFILDGIEYFSKPEAVLKAISETFSKDLLFLQKKYSLPAFNLENSKLYFDALSNVKTDPDGLSSIADPYMLLNYLNFMWTKDLDGEAERSLLDIDSAIRLNDLKFLEFAHSKFINSTPTTDRNAEFTQFLDGIGKITLRSAVPQFNVGAATNYAMKYAVNPNYSTYKVFDKDCTNFASQILAAGGQTMSRSWYYYQLPQGRDYHQPTYSSSWTIANEFARHWGITRKTRSWSTFASRVSPGAFVGYARPDGVVEHIGFVTKFAGMATDEGITYRSFAIAQHSKNYHAWVHGDEGAKGWRSVNQRNSGYWVTR